MNSSNNKYPGFIDGLKASNINNNKVSLNVYSEQIKFNLNNIMTAGIDFPPTVNDNLKFAFETIRDTVEHEKSASELLIYYIKFGDLYKSIISALPGKVDQEILKEIAINYLNIAKFSKDTRVKNLAIEIAKAIE